MLDLFMNGEEDCISQKTADTYSIFLLSCYKSALFVPICFVTQQIKKTSKNVYMQMPLFRLNFKKMFTLALRIFCNF